MQFQGPARILVKSQYRDAVRLMKEPTAIASHDLALRVPGDANKPIGHQHDRMVRQSRIRETETIPKTFLVLFRQIVLSEFDGDTLNDFVFDKVLSPRN